MNTRKMKVADFNKALVIAQADVNIDPVEYETDHMFGCGLKGFVPVVVRIEEVARFLIWQCAQFDGGWDEEESENCKYIATRKFLLEVK